MSAAEALADLVTDQDIEVGRMYPPLSTLRDCSIKIAAKVAEDAYQDRTASTYPEPADKEDFIRLQLYDYNYDGVSSLPARYSWPEEVVKAKIWDFSASMMTWHKAMHLVNKKS